MITKYERIEHFILNDEKGREAVIEFRDNEFHNCVYKGCSAVYNFRDWKFLFEVSKKILDLSKEKVINKKAK